MSKSHDQSGDTRETRPRKVLFLAQTPPPHHGQSAIAALVRSVFEADAKMVVDQRWRGGAQSNKDVGKKSIGKLLGFFGFVIELLMLLVTAKRYDFAYLGIAPWAHTAMRDMFLAGLAKRLAKRTWIHVHGNGLSELVEHPGLRGLLARWLLSGTEVIAITEDACQKAKALGLFSRVLPLANMSVDPGETEKQSQGKITIACLGNLDPRKGVLDFVDIVSAVAREDKRVQAVIIGGETAQLSVEDVKARAATHGVADHINVTGWVTEEHKTDLLSEADIFLYMSRHDLAPVALIEALAHGCAPIVLDIGGLAEMIGPQLHSNVIVDTESERALPHALDMIRAYLGVPELLAQDKARARHRYLTTYSPEIFKSTLLGFLKSADDAGPSHSEPSSDMIASQPS